MSYATKLTNTTQSNRNNRKELKKVLDYYSKNPADSLKKNAALFLIENMDENYSWQNKSWDFWEYRYCWYV